MAHKIACGPSKLAIGGPAEFLGNNSVCRYIEKSMSLVGPLKFGGPSKIGIHGPKSGPLKILAGPQKFDLKGPSGP